MISTVFFSSNSSITKNFFEGGAVLSKIIYVVSDSMKRRYHCSVFIVCQVYYLQKRTRRMILALNLDNLDNTGGGYLYNRTEYHLTLSIVWGIALSVYSYILFTLQCLCLWSCILRQTFQPCCSKLSMNTLFFTFFFSKHFSFCIFRYTFNI